MPASPLEVLAEELGTISGQLERETRLRVAAAIADLQRHDAERELRFSKLHQLIESRLMSLKDGASGERGPEGPQGQQGTQGERGERGEIGPQGLQGDRGITGESGQIGETGPQGLKGDSGERGSVGPQGDRGETGSIGPQGERGLQGERGDIGPQGLMPMARAWSDQVHYQNHVVTHAGSLYQAARDTAKEPPHADWVCIAAAGKGGADGRSFTICGTYQPEAIYNKLDVVSLNGASFAAKRDKPGVCPGDGWQLIAKQGGPGKPGEQGRPGKVERGPKVEALSISGEGLLTLRHEDGSTVTCDLYPLLAKIS